MRLFPVLAAFALAGCATHQPRLNVAESYLAYRIALDNAADYAEGPHAMASTVNALANFNETPEMKGAADTAETWVMCKLNKVQPHAIPDYDCSKLPKDLKPVADQLTRGAFVLRQGTFSVKDMHGQPTKIGATHDAH